ncbi:PspC domain-containing protein [Dermatophilaceae bacterium Soc4.6]
MTTTPQSQSSGTGLDRLFATLRRSPVSRSSDHVIAGVCSGLAQRLGVSVKVVRILAVVAALLGPALVLYLAAWLMLPDGEGRVHLEQALKGGRTSSILLLVATVLVLVPDAGLHARVGWIVPLAVAGVVGWFVWNRRRSAPASAPTTAPDAAAPQSPSLVKPSQTPPPQDSWLS